MKFNILIVTAIFLWVGHDLTHAQQRTFRGSHARWMGSSIGTIRKIGRNTLEIYDERERMVKNFVYLSQNDNIKVGERVHIYYSPNRIVQMIKKMTPVSYKPQTGNNFGYIIKSDDN